MNKLSRILAILFVATCLTLTLVGTASAKATKTPFTGSEIWFADSPVGSVRMADGNILLLRGFESKFNLTTTDPRVKGVDVVQINANFKMAVPPVNFYGQMWGTFTITNNEGFWQGTWTGIREENGFSYIDFVAYGGGDYAGLQLRCHIERLSPDPAFPETLNGYILDPG